MDLSLFFEPLHHIDLEVSPYELGYHVDFHDTEFPDWPQADLVVVGCRDERGGSGIHGSAQAPDLIRSVLYTLVPPAQHLRVADLGNLIDTDSPDETYALLAQVTETVLKKGLTLILLGATQDQMYGLYRGFERLESEIEYVAIDNSPDIYNSDQVLNHRSVNHRIILHQPRYLDHFSVLGTQSYYITEEEKQALRSLNYETVRLGDLRNDMRIAEPYFRQASLVSFDLSCVRQSDAPGTNRPSPAGFTTEEACQLARFAGLGYIVNAVGFFEVNPELDYRHQTSHLTALVVWHFIQGVYNRLHDRPRADRSNMRRYRIALESTAEEIVFYKSPETQRWWMEIDDPAHMGRPVLVPCSEVDYQAALNDEIPERWWLARHKMV